MVDRIQYEMLIPTIQIEWQRRATRERLAAQAQSAPVLSSVRIRIGSILIAAGCRLQEHGAGRPQRDLALMSAPCAGFMRS